MDNQIKEIKKDKLKKERKTEKEKTGAYHFYKVELQFVLQCFAVRHGIKP